MTLTDILHVYRLEHELKIIFPDDSVVRATPLTALKHVSSEWLDCEVKEIKGNYDNTIDIILA